MRHVHIGVRKQRSKFAGDFIKINCQNIAAIGLTRDRIAGNKLTRLMTKIMVAVLPEQGCNFVVNMRANLGTNAPKVLESCQLSPRQSRRKGKKRQQNGSTSRLS